MVCDINIFFQHKKGEIFYIFNSKWALKLMDKIVIREGQGRHKVY
jgi:hypothetical protein